MTNPQSNHHCPICDEKLEFIERYPNYICWECANKATDENGRKLLFGNLGMSGGYAASYADNGDTYDSHICYVEGLKCFANEARFGGIVIEKLNTQ